MKNLLFLCLLGCIVESSFAVKVTTGTKSSISINTNSSDSVKYTATSTGKYPVTAFDPQEQTIGPFGGSEGTPFNFSAFDFGQSLATLIVSYNSSALTSLQITYQNDLSWLISEEYPDGTRPIASSPIAGAKAGQVSEWDRSDRGYIKQVSVCTGKLGNQTVVTALRFVTNLNKTTTFGAYNRINTKCENVTPNSSGYYLDYLSGLAGTTINQLTFHWKSDFLQQRACVFDEKCVIPIDFCYQQGSRTCCMKKADGEIIGRIRCRA